jgi:predicted dehydrogenase
VKALVVGYGSIGARHASNLVKLGVEDVAVCEVDAALRAVAATRHARVTAELDAALAGRPDVVLVCVPTHLHAAVAVAALDAGADVFVEKPIAVALADADRIVAKQAQTGRIVMVGCNMRFHPGVQALRELVDAAALGAIQLVNAHFGHALPSWRPGADYRRTYSARIQQGGGVLMEGIHEFDYVDWLGGGIADVRCVGGRSGTLEIDGEDTALAYCRLTDGGAAVIRLDLLRPEKRRGCEIVGTRGMARWLSVGKAPETLTVERLAADGAGWRKQAADTYDGNEMYLAALRQFLAAVRREAPPAVDAAQARRMLALVLAARRQLAGAGADAR